MRAKKPNYSPSGKPGAIHFEGLGMKTDNSEREKRRSHFYENMAGLGGALGGAFCLAVFIGWLPIFGKYFYLKLILSFTVMVMLFLAVVFILEKFFFGSKKEKE